MTQYKKWKDRPFGEQDYATYRDVFLDDLDTFEKDGIIPPEHLPAVARVRAMLKQ